MPGSKNGRSTTTTTVPEVDSTSKPQRTRVEIIGRPHDGVPEARRLRVVRPPWPPVSGRPGAMCPEWFSARSGRSSPVGGGVGVDRRGRAADRDGRAEPARCCCVVGSQETPHRSFVMTPRGTSCKLPQDRDELHRRLHGGCAPAAGDVCTTATSAASRRPGATVRLRYRVSRALRCVRGLPRVWLTPDV